MRNRSFKVCTACGVSKPAIPEFFFVHKGCKGGLHSQCKECLKPVFRKCRTEKVPDHLDEKACTRCLLTKPCTREFFDPQKGGRGGFASACKDCRVIYTRARYEREGDRLRALTRASREKHGAKWKVSARTTHWAVSLMNQVRMRAKKCGLEFDPLLDGPFLEAMLEKQGGLCYWLKIPIVPSVMNRDPQRPSLDRLDNSRGYTRDNVVVSCMQANMGRCNCLADRYGEFCEMLLSSRSTK